MRRLDPQTCKGSSMGNEAFAKGTLCVRFTDTMRFALPAICGMDGTNPTFCRLGN